MNKAQKTAWYVLFMSVVLLAIVVAVVVGRIPRAVYGLCWISIVILGLLFFRRNQKQVEVDFDERDKLINKRALLAGYFSIWSLCLAGCVVVWFTIGPEGSIPVYFLPVVLFGLFISVMIVQAVATLVQYGKGGKSNE